MSATPDDIKAKIAKLLRLARNEAASPFEAALAATKAQVLADAHRLDLASIMTDEQRSTITHTEITTVNGASWRESLAFAVVNANGCLCTYWPKTGRYQVYGHPEDIKIVTYLLGHLEALLDSMSAADYKLAEARRKSYWDPTPVHAPSYKQSWCRGAVVAITKRLDENRIDLSQNAERPRATTTSVTAPQYGLVPVNQIQAYQDATVGPLRDIRRRFTARPNAAAYRQGYAAGDTLDVHRGIATNTRQLT